MSSDRRWLAFLAADEESAERDTLEDQGFNQEIFEEELRFTRLHIADLHSAEDPDDLDVRQLALEDRCGPWSSHPTVGTCSWR